MVMGTTIMPTEVLSGDNAKFFEDVVLDDKSDKVVVVDSRLLVAPFKDAFHDLLCSTHDVYYFDFDDDGLLEKLRKVVVRLLSWECYKYVVYVGYRQSCDSFYDLYKNHGICFDAAVLIDGRNDDETISAMNKKTKKVLCINRAYEDKIVSSKKNHVAYNIKSKIPLNYSKKAALETIGFLTYGCYNVNFLPKVYGTKQKIV
jgi:hypothetical protein